MVIPHTIAGNYTFSIIVLIPALELTGSDPIAYKAIKSLL